MESGRCQIHGLICPRAVGENASTSVGLGGDGDEIAALDDVERAFGVKLPGADAHKWLTAGDVFASLQKVLPAKELDRPDLWDRFAIALCGQTGVDFNDIESAGPLLSRSRLWVHVADASAVLWIAVAATLIALMIWALF